MAPLGRRAFLKLAAQSTALMAMTIKFPSLAFSTPIKSKKQEPKYKPTDFYVSDFSDDPIPSKYHLKLASGGFKRACEHHKAHAIKDLRYERCWHPYFATYQHTWSAVLLLPA